MKRTIACMMMVVIAMSGLVGCGVKGAEIQGVPTEASIAEQNESNSVIDDTEENTQRGSAKGPDMADIVFDDSSIVAYELPNKDGFSSNTETLVDVTEEMAANGIEILTLRHKGRILGVHVSDPDAEGMVTVAVPWLFNIMSEVVYPNGLEAMEIYPHHNFVEPHPFDLYTGKLLKDAETYGGDGVNHIEWNGNTYDVTFSDPGSLHTESNNPGAFGDDKSCFEMVTQGIYYYIAKVPMDYEGYCLAILTKGNLTSDDVAMLSTPEEEEPEYITDVLRFSKDRYTFVNVDKLVKADDSYVLEQQDYTESEAAVIQEIYRHYYMTNGICNGMTFTMLEKTDDTITIRAVVQGEEYLDIIDDYVVDLSTGEVTSNWDDPFVIVQ